MEAADTATVQEVASLVQADNHGIPVQTAVLLLILIHGFMEVGYQTIVVQQQLTQDRFHAREATELM